MVHPGLKEYKDINENLKKYHLCIPPYNSINGKWINEAIGFFKQNNEMMFKGHVTAEVIIPWRRAYQTVYRYRELQIFKNLEFIIDCATIAWFEGNAVSAYLSLCPVIEGLLLRWQQEDSSGEWRGAKKFIIDKVTEIKEDLNDTELHDSWLILQSEALEHILKNVFYLSTDRECNNDTVILNGFNRHLSLHMKNPTNWADCLINTARLFIVIDIIAELYLKSNNDRYPQLSTVLDASYNDKFVDKYFKLFYKSAHNGLYKSNYNALVNKKNGFYDLDLGRI